MNSRNFLFCFFAMMALLLVSQASAVCYVKQDAVGKADGTSWADAYVNPQWALLFGCTEIWVAQGVYTPAGEGDDPTMSFVIPAGTKMYGGFAGGETAIEQRVPQTHRTTLSSTISGLASFHIVTIDPIPEGSEIGPILDGFVVTGGEARNDSENSSGGGIYCEASDGYECSPILNNLVMQRNSADYGGAIYLHSPTVRTVLSNSVLYLNQGDEQGGAIYLDYGTSKSEPQFINAAFIQNASYIDGGAIEDVGGAAKFKNCTFYQNAATQHGGAINIFHLISNGFESIVNSTFVSNASDAGTSIYNGASSALFSLQIQNTIFWGEDEGAGKNISTSGSSTIYIDDSILPSGCPVEGSCTNISADDPTLVSIGNTNDFSFLLSPLPGGSAYDNGKDGACPPVDERGLPRPQGKHCDIGAVEFQFSDDTIFIDGFQ